MDSMCRRGLEKMLGIGIAVVIKLLLSRPIPRRFIYITNSATVRCNCFHTVFRLGRRGDVSGVWFIQMNKHGRVSRVLAVHRRLIGP